MILACQCVPHARCCCRRGGVRHWEGSIIVHFALALHGGSWALSWAQLAPCIILLLMRRVASARFWGHRDLMMSGSTAPSIHNQRFIGMHQHYWTQRYRLSKSLSDNIGNVQWFILDAQCWIAGEPHFRPANGQPAPQHQDPLSLLPLLQWTTTTPQPAGLPHS